MNSTEPCLKDKTRVFLKRITETKTGIRTSLKG